MFSPGVQQTNKQNYYSLKITVLLLSDWLQISLFSLVPLTVQGFGVCEVLLTAISYSLYAFEYKWMNMGQLYLISYTLYLIVEKMSAADEEKRTRRKERQPSTSKDNSSYRCVTCGKACGSRIGLFSHARSCSRA